jgi:hypothetical protein
VSLFFRRPSPLPPPAGGQRDFWVTVHVRFSKPIYDVDDPLEPPVQGYYRNFGVRCAPGSLHALIEAAVDDGTVVWADTEWREVDPGSLDRGIRRRVVAVEGEGLWYSSGRILYADTDLEEEPN